MDQDSDQDSCVVGWAEPNFDDYNKLMGLNNGQSMTQQVEEMLREQDSVNSLSSDNSNKNVPTEVSFKSEPEDLTDSFNDADNDNELLEIDVAKLISQQHGQNKALRRTTDGTLEQYLRESDNNADYDRELLQIDVPKLRSQRHGRTNTLRRTTDGSLEQYLHEKGDRDDGDLMNIDLDKIQALNQKRKNLCATFSQYLREEENHDDSELSNIDLSKLQALPLKRKDLDHATPNVQLSDVNKEKSKEWRSNKVLPQVDKEVVPEVLLVLKKET